MENMWPIIDNIKTTEEIMPFLNLTIDMLKESYEGKIEAQICQIEYILKNMQTALSSFRDIAKLVGPQVIDDKYEEKMEIEKDRKPAYVSNRDYKYEIFNDHLYYKLFTINIPEYYPIKIHVSAGILEKDDVEFEINDIDKMKDVFTKIVNSDKVKMIIKKMKSK